MSNAEKRQKKNELREQRKRDIALVKAQREAIKVFGGDGNLDSYIRRKHEEELRDLVKRSGYPEGTRVVVMYELGPRSSGYQARIFPPSSPISEAEMLEKMRTLCGPGRREATKEEWLESLEKSAAKRNLERSEAAIRIAEDLQSKTEANPAQARKGRTEQSNKRRNEYVTCALEILEDRKTKPTLNQLAGLVAHKYPDWKGIKIGEPCPSEKAISHQLEKEKDGSLRGKIQSPKNRSRD